MRIEVVGQWGAYPQAGGATAGYLLEHNDTKVLIDCGSGVLTHLQRHTPLYDLNTVLISHQHHDHVADLGCLQYACLIDTDLRDRLEDLEIFIANDSDTSPLYKSMKGSRIMSMNEHFHHSVDSDLEVTFFPTFHEVYCLGMKFRYQDKLAVFTADTHFDESLIEHCKNAEILIAETSFYAEQDAKPYGHMNTRDVAKLAREANVKSVILTHLPHFGDVSQLVKEVEQEYDGEVILAKAGLSLTL